MEKKIYEKPTLHTVRLADVDLLSSSGEGDCYVEDPYDDEYGLSFA